MKSFAKEAKKWFDTTNSVCFLSFYPYPKRLDYQADESKQIYSFRQICARSFTVCGNALLQVQAELIDGLIDRRLRMRSAADGDYQPTGLCAADGTIDQFRLRLHECLEADGGKFEHYLPNRENLHESHQLDSLISLDKIKTW